MPDLQLIGAPQSNYVWVCRIACAEKGVPYTLVPVFPHTQEVDAIHPLGKIPALRHGAFTLCESRAICCYIDRAFAGPNLVPREPLAAARVEQWLSIVNTARRSSPCSIAPSQRPATLPARTSPSPTSTCCRSSIILANCRKARR